MLKIINLEEISSTQDYAKNIITESSIGEDLAILAKIQTAGRGRLNQRTWQSANGNFHCSFVINIKKLNFFEKDISYLNSISIEAVYEVLSKITNSPDKFHMKLPNDIYVNSKKISGVLVEVLYPFAIIGIGINLIESPLEISTDIKKEFNLLVKKEELVENLYMSLVNRIRDEV